MAKLNTNHVALERVEIYNDIPKLTAIIKINIRPGQKHVFVVCTTDNWTSKHNYNSKIITSDSDSQTIETYAVDIPLPSNISSPDQKVEFRICYKTGSSKEEYWDSNDGNNYKLGTEQSTIRSLFSSSSMISNNPGPSSNQPSNQSNRQSSRPGSALSNGFVSRSSSPIYQTTQKTPFVNDYRFNLVILRCPELEIDEDEKEDRELVHKICAAASVGKAKIIYIYRQGPKKHGQLRPLLIHFVDMETPKVLLQRLKQKNMTAIVPKGVWIRRDFSSQEKKAEQKAHSRCVQLNKQAGQKKFYVDDNFEIKEHKKTRDLNKN